jgi:hypothetical protein
MHERRALELNVTAPVLLSRLLIFVQLLPLISSYKFDLKLMEIQKDGIPFLFQDVPHIPAICDEYQ